MARNFGDIPARGSGGMPVKQSFTRNLDEHVGYIQGQLCKSIRDGETRQLAVRLVSGSFDDEYDRRTGQEVRVVRGFGKNFLAPPGPTCVPKDAACEIEKIWDFVVLNFRYVYDPADIDTFATVRESLDAGGGDCDDGLILFAGLLMSIGFPVVARVISTTDAPDTWVHIYPLVGNKKDDPTKWIPLDMTVEGATPGWEYQHIARTRDYLLHCRGGS